jgi:hypothetical protein
MDIHLTHEVGPGSVGFAPFKETPHIILRRRRGRRRIFNGGTCTSLNSQEEYADEANNKRF